LTIIKKQLGIAFVLAVTLLLLSTSTDSETNVYKLYFLGGQSNMVGYGLTDELPSDLRREIDRVMIFEGRAASDGDRRGGIGVWMPLEPGHGFGVEADSRGVRLSNLFGPELSFGHSLASELPDTRIALVKYALGGSALAPGVGLGGWHPTDKNGHRRNQFDHAMKTLRNALADEDIDGDGVRDLLIPAGIIWMHGESDANSNLETARRYRENLEQLVQALRTTLGKDTLPVVIGKITDSKMADDGMVMDHIAAVQEAQVRFTEADHCAELVTVTEDLNYRNDAWHYDTDGFIQLGEAFAEAVLRLERNCSQGSRS
jgi:hypothetical protein